MAGEVIKPRPHHWLGLCLATESNRQAEWPLIGQVIYNRVASNRYPDTLEGVILQRSQFSAFNLWTKASAPPADTWNAVAGRVCIQVGGALLLAYAIDAAARMDELMSDEAAEVRRISFDITPETLHYWSPVSMVPKGRKPAWAPSASRIYSAPGIDPERFQFAENVP